MTALETTAATAAGLARVLPLALGDDGRALGRGLDELAAAGDDRAVRTLIRVGLLQPRRTTMWYQRLLNRWECMDCPPLKPNAVQRSLAVLCDHTIDNVTPLVRAFAAGLGVHLDVAAGAYDSVELDALNPGSAVYARCPDLVAVVLSAHWLHRRLGHGGLVDEGDLEATIGTLRRIADALLEHSSARVLVTSFAPPRHAPPAGHARAGRAIGWASALNRLNAALEEMQDDRLMVLDQPSAVHAAGGATAYSLANYARAKMPYEPAGAVALAREIAAACASVCGKAHRALVTDLDNTLWGGVIGDAGRHGVATGQDTPDGLGYYLLQAHLRGLTSLGVLLAVASKNDPAVQSVFRDNDDVALRLEDLSSIQISWEPKSRSIAQIAVELGFGPEHMVFVDDNVFELAEALGRHGDLDVLRAHEDPLDTLDDLASARLFHSVQLTDADLARHGQIAARQASAQLQASFDDYEQYLRAIHVRVSAVALDESNRRRVVQMLQKSSQFNLTTRRHAEADLRRLAGAGATIGVFSYEDDFGPQGVIAVVILLPGPDGLCIESWVMSCRVLNRTVEEAIAGWIVRQAGPRPVIGEFIATEKNGIVRDLYVRLGFDKLDGDEKRSRWIFDAAAGCALPAAIAELTPTVS